ncbi:MAG: Rrf2 family transcriptional regulator [Bacteroidales bacterium]|nr:Rrf2 family transcriptional regulator [Bacteroidales bacterium]MCF8334124.1 Rrf2 family transcriptional regulator [Bacteroidales bacterium]
MRSNTKVRYGLRAMIQIGMESDKGILQKDIAKKQEISNKYLDQIIAPLKAEGLIEKAQNTHAGYILSHPAHKITAYDIYKAFEPELSIVPCAPEEGKCHRQNMCAAVHFWSGLNQKIKEYFESQTLQQLIDIQTQLTPREEQAAQE